MQVPHRQSNAAILIAGIMTLIVSIGVARFAFTSFLPFMLESHLDVKFTGILAALNYAGYLSGSILAVFIKEIQTKVILLRIGLFLCIVTTIILGVTEDPTLWIVSRLIAGFGSAMGVVVGSALVMYKLDLPDKTKAMGIHFSGIGVAILFSDVVMHLAMEAGMSWQKSWIVLSLAGALIAIYPFVVLSFDQAQKAQALRHRFDLSLFASPFILLLIPAYFTEGVGFVVQATFLPDIINTLPGLEGLGSLTWLLVGIAGIPSAIIWMYLATRYGTVTITILVMLIQAVGIMIPAWTHHPALNLLSGILYGGTFIALVALFMNLGGKLAGKNPVVLMGALTTAYGIGQVCAPLYSIALFEKYHNYDAALYVTAAIVIGGALLLMVARKLPRARGH